MNTQDTTELSIAIRRAWPPQAPGAELRARALRAALESLRGSRRRRARALAVRLAVALYGCLGALAGLSLAASNSHAVFQEPGMVLLAVAGFAAGVAASADAARWGAEAGLGRMRWLPAAGVCAAFALLAAASLLQARAAPGYAGVPTTRDPLEAVSRAFTATLPAAEAQAWLNEQLPADVERAWFVTPDGLIALSSITTANEISRSVIDFMLTPQLRQWMTLTQAAAISHPVGAPGAALAGASRLTVASVVSPPLALLAVVKEALRAASIEPAPPTVSAEPVLDAGGRFAGVAAVSRAPDSPRGMLTLAGIAAGLFALSASWAAWVYWIERRIPGRPRPGAVKSALWAALTALMPPIGVLVCLSNQRDEAA
jgi:hypothetical protein